MSEVTPEPPKSRRWPWRLALVIVAVLVVVGPWPVDDSGFEGSAYQSRTLDRLEKSKGRSQAGPIRVGMAEVDLTPTGPRPLAGFIGQIRTPYVGVDSPCSARALTVDSASGRSTILTADLLLINAKMARAVCDRAGVGPEEVYFTASHTHGGPGGWGDHPLEMLVAGAYDPAYFEELADRLADVVRRSRAQLEPAELGFVQVWAKHRQSNRVEKGSTTHDALSALVFRPADAPENAPPLAILAVFGAHATVSHPVPPRLGGDYPAALVADLKRRTGARMVLFAAGAVGDASPSRPKAPSQAESAAKLGSSLADDLITALPSARFEREPIVGNLRLDVDLPPVRWPFVVGWLRFSPLASWWIADRQTRLHALRMGPAILVGFPGDYSGHLADALVGSFRETGLSAVATSFDGDFRGYLVSRRVFRDVSCYETRLMNFYGPWTGEYLNEVARRMAQRLANGPSFPRPAVIDDRGPRIALGVLLVCAIAAGWRRPGDLGTIVRSVGWTTMAVGSVAVLAFVIDPDAVAWATFQLPTWARMIALAPAVLGLTQVIRGNWGGAVFLLALAGSVFSASWVVVLMIARGGAKWGLKGCPGAARTAASAT